MNDDELRDSVRGLGPLLPVIKSAGSVVDGHRRERLAIETGHRPRVLELEPVDALRALWVLHPERAIERAGKCTLNEYSDRFNVSPLSVAQFLRTQRLQVAPAVDVASFGGKSVLVTAWWPPRLKVLAEASANQRGQTLSEFLREAVSLHVSRSLPAESVRDLNTALRPGPPANRRALVGTEHRPLPGGVCKRSRR